MTENSDSQQLRPGLWQTVNDRYPGSMISNSDRVPLASLSKPLSESRVCFVSTSGVQPKNSKCYFSDRATSGIGWRRRHRRFDQEFLYVHWLQHGPRKIAGYVSQKFGSGNCGRETGCRHCGPCMTDLPSVNRVGPTRNRTYRNSNGVSFSGAGYYRTRETTPPLLDRITTAQQSGDVFFFDYTWAQARKEAKQLAVDVKDKGAS